MFHKVGWGQPPTGRRERTMSTIIPLLTEHEKQHISERQPLPETYLGAVGRRDGRAHRGRARRGSARGSSSSAITISATR